jgi:hypothetical protein
VKVLPSDDTTLKEAYSSFKQRFSFDDFQSKLNSLKNDKWNFVRATLLYQQSLKCEKCNPNVAMVLLCSCADAMQLEETSHKGFMAFYKTYCPAQFQNSLVENSPIEYMPNGKPPLKTAPFEKALHFIYKQFRSMYVHEGKGHLEILPEHIMAHNFWDTIEGENDIYVVDMLNLVKWFGKITFESLSAMLINEK